MERDIKRLTTLALSLLLALCLAACGKEEKKAEASRNADPFVGSWICTKEITAYSDGTSREYIPEAGESITLTFENGGIFTRVETEPGEQAFPFSGSYSVSGNTATATITQGYEAVQKHVYILVNESLLTQSEQRDSEARTWYFAKK